MLKDINALTAAAGKAVAETAITDIHTHLFPPSHDGQLLWGIDEILTYHYLVAELFTVAPAELTYEKFWALPKQAQADLVWEHVFLGHGAMSEAARGAITALTELGLDVAGRDLGSVRKWFDNQDINEYIHSVFDLANIDYAVMTNNPFNAAEADCWRRELPCPDCLKAALRIDPLLVAWPAAAKAMSEQGYDVGAQCDEKTFEQVRRFLTDWSKKIQPVYFAASVGADFAYGDDSPASRMIDKAIMPAADEAGVPLALMIGVRRAVNPALRDGGDGVGVADVSALMRLLQRHPGAKFLVTILSRVNQQELCVLARKFANLHVFGCWWFCNNPSIVEEMTRQRLELLGTAFTCQHSDARVLEQVIYKWSHTRKVVADVLADKYADLFAAGWRPSADEVGRDVRRIFGGSFAEFLAK